MADTAYVSPLAQSERFMPWLVDVCKRERIQVVLSGSELVLEALAAHANMIREQTGAICVVSPPEVLRRGRDKLETCRWLQDCGLPAPRFAQLSDSTAVDALVSGCGFPLIAKPRFGKGSDAILTIRDERHLAEVVGATEMLLPHLVTEMLLQEHLGDQDEEYTAGCFCDRTGELKGTIVMRRGLHTGTTARAELGSFPEVSEMAGAIVARLRPLGPCNVQLRQRDGQPVPFEINPRFSGTTAVRARMGFNEVDAAIRHFVLGEDAPSLAGVKTGIALRYWNEVYVPSDAVAALRRDGRLEDVGALDVQVERWGCGP